MSTYTDENDMNNNNNNNNNNVNGGTTLESANSQLINNNHKGNNGTSTHLSTKQRYLKSAMNLPNHFLKRSALSNVTNTHMLSAPNTQQQLNNNNNNTNNNNNSEKMLLSSNKSIKNNHDHDHDIESFQDKENDDVMINGNEDTNGDNNAISNHGGVIINNNNNNNNNNRSNSNSNSNFACSSSSVSSSESNNENNENAKSSSTSRANSQSELKPSVVKAAGLISQTRNIANSSKINGRSTAISELQDAIHVSKNQYMPLNGDNNIENQYNQDERPMEDEIDRKQNVNSIQEDNDVVGEFGAEVEDEESVMSQSSLMKKPLEVISENETGHQIMGQSSRIPSSSIQEQKSLQKFVTTTGKRPISIQVDSIDLKKFKAEEHVPSSLSQHDGSVKSDTQAYLDNNTNVENNQANRETVYFEYEWEDLDAEDINDPFMVSEYVVEIFEYLHQLEIATLPKKEDLFKHPNINQNRDILVNWMVKIHNKFGLLPETLFLAMNIMDRFLCKERVQLDKLQLVGTASLFIACKYEEVYSPSCKHFAQETDGACDEEEIKEGEKFILQTLDFQLNYPNPMNFLRRISKADDYDIQSRTLAKYLLEISIIDFRFIGVLPSMSSAAAMFLSRKMLGKGYWDGNLIHYSGGYTKDDLQPICAMMMDYLEQPVVHDEFYKKYASRKYMKASVISRQWAKKVISQGYNVMNLHES